MLAGAGIGAERLDTIQEEAKAEMEEAYRIAAASAWPEKHLAYADVQDVGDPRERAF
jgi:pyruvate dehydrogenase E1 component alpha subunit